MEKRQAEAENARRKMQDDFRKAAQRAAFDLGRRSAIDSGLATRNSSGRLQTGREEVNDSRQSFHRRLHFSWVTDLLNKLVTSGGPVFLAEGNRILTAIGIIMLAVFGLKAAASVHLPSPWQCLICPARFISLPCS